MKKLTAALLALVMALTLCTAAWADDDTIEISTAEDFKNFIAGINGTNAYKDKTIILKDDIDLENATLTQNTGTFAGKLNGGNHTVKNFTMSKPLCSSHMGTTATIKDLTIENVTLANTEGNQARLGIVCKNLNGSLSNVTVKNCAITSTEALGVVGGLAAMTQNGSKIENCKVDGLNVTTNNGAVSIGGAVGLLIGGNVTVTNVSATNTTVTAKAETPVGSVFGMEQSFVEEGSTVSGNSGSEPSVTYTGAVAEVNGTLYASLQSAVNAAANGDTVKIISDISISSTDTSYGKEKNIYVGIVDKSITLDLNGKTIKWALTDDEKKSKNWFTFYIRTTEATASANVTVLGNGKVNELDGGEYHAFSLGGVGDVELTIENGTFYGCEAVMAYPESSGSKNVVINGGEYISCVKAGNHTNGTNTCNCNHILNIKGSGQSDVKKITMYGGSLYGIDPHSMNDGNMVADGYTVVYSKETEMYTVVPVVYTVTFDSNGGSAVDSVTVNHGKFVVKPDDPTRTGYTFEGWYVTNGDGTEVAYDFTKPADANLDLTAHWTAKPHKGITNITTPTTETKAESPKTFDAGVAVYGVMAVTSALGMGYIGKKKI